MRLRERVIRRVLPRVLPPPVAVRHAEYSMLFSADDDAAQPTARLIQLALEAVKLAQSADLASVSARITSGIDYAAVWPGEHYKLLAGLMLALKPKSVIEIGTATGLSAIALKSFMLPDARIATFDVIPWRDYPETVLTTADFDDQRLVQHLDDLQQSASVERHRSLLEGADFIFIDAAKDGVMEQRFIDNLLQLKYQRSPIVMFDDIRVWNMLGIWRKLPRPRLDLTSFGHWSGTGLVDWSSTV